MISHYSLLGTLSNRPVVKGTRKPESLCCSTENYSNLFADLKREQLKPLTKIKQINESESIQSFEEQVLVLVKKK